MATATVQNIKDKLGLTDEVRLGTTSSSPFLGSPTFDEIPFHVGNGKTPALGTYIIIERHSDNIVHYGRIISGTEDNPRADPSSLQQNQVLGDLINATEDLKGANFRAGDNFRVPFSAIGFNLSKSLISRQTSIANLQYESWICSRGRRS